jgi:hypothetical protein
VLLVLSVAGAARADTTDTADPLPPPCDTCEPVIVADTILYVPPPAPSAGGAVTNPVDLEERLYQNPTRALFKSVLIPGWGQLGNRRYVKAGVIFAVESLFIGAYLHYNKQVADARDRFESAQSIEARNNWYDYLENKRKNRGKYAWFAGITIFLSMFDAYVDAHLSGSPTAERNEGVGLDDVSFDIQPDGDGVKASLNLSF